MRLRVVSDLHFEFQRDNGKSLMKDLVKDSAFDVLVVAGDLTSAERLTSGLECVAAATDKPIIYVLGNHEYYGGSFKSVLEEARAFAAEHLHLHLLEEDALTIQGQRFVGCTLWYPHPKDISLDEDMGDFTYIYEAGVGPAIHAKALSAAEYLRKTVQKGDVIVTHFLPHARSIAPKFKGSIINRYFLHNVGDVVEKEPSLWIHGHTHVSLDYRVGKTRVVCNPFGYAKNQADEPNPKFNERFTVEV